MNLPLLPPWIDHRTLVAVTVLLAVICTVALAVTALRHREMGGVGSWAAGFLCTTLGMAFVALGNWLPLAFTIVAVNTCMIAGNAFVWVGVNRYRGLPAPFLELTAIVGASALFMLVASQAVDWMAGRIAYLAAANACLQFLSAYALLREAPRPATTMGRLVAGIFLFDAFCNVVRGVLLPQYPQPLSFASPSPLFTVSLLVALVSGMMRLLGLLTLVSDRLREDLEHAATHDTLTGLLNRRAFARAADREMARMVRTGRHAAVLLMDIDHFKAVNDTRGHSAGDVVLRAFAALVAREVRPTDLCARHGGEEFCLMLPDTPIEGALVVAERIRLATPAAAGVTVSIGAAALVPGHDLQEAVNRADKALYTAKRTGRNRVVCSGVPEVAFGAPPARGSGDEATPEASHRTGLRGKAVREPA